MLGNSNSIPISVYDVMTNSTVTTRNNVFGSIIHTSALAASTANAAAVSSASCCSITALIANVTK
jgi:hypothetical protein